MGSDLCLAEVDRVDAVCMIRVLPRAHFKYAQSESDNWYAARLLQ
jgi:hypothetical protein